MAKEKRKVSTDALETLGTIIQTGKRDAIHLAVEPVIAGERLWPGHDVGIVDGKATTKATKKLGIVDPFIKGAVPEGEMFWLIVYPRTITSLRHVWEHPDFSGYVGPDPEEVRKEQEKDESEEWLREFCHTHDIPAYGEVVENFLRGKSDGEYFHFSGTDASGSIPDEFWDHMEKVTGKEIKSRQRAAYFSCSC
jgi:hypothetical protein